MIGSPPIRQSILEFGSNQSLSQLLGIKRVIAYNRELRVNGLASIQKSLIPTDDYGLFRGEEESAATVAFIEEDGELFFVSAAPRDGNHRRIPDWWCGGRVRLPSTAS